MSSVEKSKQGLLSMNEAAAWLGVSKATVCRLMARNELSHYRVGYRVLFDEAQLRGYLTRVERKADVKDDA